MGRVNISKVALFCFLVVVIGASVLPTRLGFALIQANNYESVVNILDHAYVSQLYFVRVVMENLDYMTFQWTKLYATMVTSLSYFNVLVMALCAYVWAINKERWMQARYKNIALQVIAFYLFGYAMIAFVLMFGFQAGSAQMVIHLFQMSGGIMIVIHLCLAFYCLYYFFLFLSKDMFPYIKKQFPQT